ncbi:MAG: hypothetical protein M1821_002198 [Bathelium mastoideum]|nr:MAG: hypothetical protein M1821_002198 [Bathelium mastoideum]
MAAVTPPMEPIAELVEEIPRRQSIFREILDDEDDEPAQSIATPSVARPPRTVRFRTETEILNQHEDESWEDVDEAGDQKVNASETVLVHPLPAAVQSTTSSRFYRIGALALLLALMLPLVHDLPFIRNTGPSAFGVKGGVIRGSLDQEGPILVEETLQRRQSDPMDVCTRFSQQSAVVNGTLFVYGGRNTTQDGQTGQWDNSFFSMDLTKNWQISTPTMSGLPSAPSLPAVANAYLWNSFESIFLYGGEHSNYTSDRPGPCVLWEYNVLSSSWIQHGNPSTSAGDNAAPDGQPVQCAAEGAGVTATQLGRGWFFGGHLDQWTTEGWTYQNGRVYLKSLLEYTFPGFANNGVQSLSGGSTAGSDGVYRNITEGGSQNEAGFTERADGILVFIPGFGAEGILLGLAGGTFTTYTQMNVIDVYDIATSTWYKQATSGTPPGFRVNPCAVVAAAPDGSSYNMYMYGGQNLQPAGNQTQYGDTWVLTVPSFTWIQVNTDGQPVPPPRAGHTCNVWDAQMIVVGGYVGQELSCDSPGIYVFDMSNLKWVNSFTALSAGSSANPDPQVNPSSSTGQDNPLNQQPAQIGTSNTSGLIGSFGYQVPEEIVSIVGGSPGGGATITAPAQSATSGPLATGKPITYTTTNSAGALVTETSLPGPGVPTGNAKSGPNVGAIVAGVIAGVLFIIACYLAFVAWLYRKQLQLYKHHVTAAQRQASRDPRMEKSFVLPPPGRHSNSQRDGSPQSSKFAASSQTATNSGTGPGTVASGQQRYEAIRRDSESSAEDLLGGREPTFWGTALNPRRSLRVINRD